MPREQASAASPQQPATDPAAETPAAPARRGFFRRREKDAVAQAVAEPVADEAADDDESDSASGRFHERSSGTWRRILSGSGACFFSMLVHLVGLLVLGWLAVPAQVKTELKTLVSSIVEERPEDEPVEIELEQTLEAATEVTQAVFSSAPLVGASGTVSGGPMNATMELDQKVVEEFTTTTEVTIEAPTLALPTSKKLIDAIPEGEFKGDPRAIVDNYEQAMDRITQEINWLLDKGPVLVVWCFDQSESMKDDQAEIVERINRVYTELGLVNRDNGDMLLTSVTSYGGNVLWNLKPTSNRDEIRNAISSIPIDPSGKEMMCEAVGKSVAWHREYRRGGRRMMLILVTDESGDRQNNNEYLELAIGEAKSQDCRIYCLGRESVFGYPYAHMRWKHPQTGHVHWLPVDRGPETGFVEQLQTNGFHRRYDAFASGFGPYEQTRMARETGGIFFMLPTLESALVRAQGNLDERRYELEAMRAYRPDLRARIEVFADRDRYPLRTLIWKVVSDLDPHNNKAARSVEVRLEFAIDLPSFVRQARENQQKAKLLIGYFGWAQKLLEEGRTLRDQEPEPRWQGNYDIILAQTVAYQARLYEYGVALEEFIKSPKTAPLTKAPNLHLVHWDAHTVKKTRSDESLPYIEKSIELFQTVIDNHPGTPWAARAKWELARGFGVDFVPDYDRPYTKPTGPLIPVPKY
ncbi:MAG: VWA domain-containing protein [Planctomycetales bacterium]|nr:VWA domain-containing protein [Planctomycetales bacterium]